MNARSGKIWGVLFLLATGSAAAQGSGLDHAAHAHHGGTEGSVYEAEIAAFVAAARAASEPYHDRGRAIADGFRMLGPDFPLMGEHWVHPGRMVDGTLDVARPQALSYALIGGKPVLVGVIYARPLRGDEEPPEFPLPGHPWHDHVGAVDEESVLLHHVVTGAGSAADVRLAMLHAWIWADNPDGLFSADNLALPFQRLRLRPPAEIPGRAARALSLASGGEAYYRMLFRALASPTPQDEQAAYALIARAAARVSEWHAARLPGEEVGAADLDLLSRLWVSLWGDVSAAIESAGAERLQLLITP